MIETTTKSGRGPLSDIAEVIKEHLNEDWVIVLSNLSGAGEFSWHYYDIIFARQAPEEQHEGIKLG